jgi:hypothetical protein
MVEEAWNLKKNKNKKIFAQRVWWACHPFSWQWTSCPQARRRPSMASLSVWRARQTMTILQGVNA